MVCLATAFDFFLIHLFHAFAKFVFNISTSRIELFDAFAQTAHEFRNFIAAKQQKDDDKNEEDFLSAQTEYQK